MNTTAETASARFRPDSVRILFVAESPRAHSTSFYSMDSALYSATKDVFHVCARDLLRAQNFLRSFQQMGCYLVNLYDRPAHGLSEAERDEARQRGIERLAEAIREMEPSAVIDVEPAIVHEVDDAVSLSGWTPDVRANLPFPHRQHVAAYSDELKSVLGDLRQRGVLHA